MLTGDMLRRSAYRFPDKPAILWNGTSLLYRDLHARANQLAHALLGLGLNEVIDGYLRNEQIPLEGPFFVVTWELVAGALVFAAFVGIVAGLYPAFRAARLDPLAALRHE